MTAWEPKVLCPETQLAVIDALNEAGCLKFGDFTLASGQKSIYFCACPRLISKPRQEAVIVEAFAELFSGIDVDLFVGIPDGAHGLAALVGSRLGIGRILLRKERKDHGLGDQIAGEYENNLRPNIWTISFLLSRNIASVC